MNSYSHLYDCFKHGISMMDSADLQELLVNLEKYILSYDRTTKKYEAYDKLNSVISFYNDYLTVVADKYFILKGKDSLRRFLWQIWSDTGCLFTENIEKRIKIIRFIIALPGYKNLMPKTARSLLQHIENKFSYCSKIFQEQYLKMLLFNYFPVLFKELPAKITSDKETLTPQNVELPRDQALALFRDFGNILYIRVTGAHDNKPDKFWMLEQALSYAGMDFYNKTNLEIFTTCFIFTVIRGTNLEKENGLHVLSETNKDILEQYFQKLIDSPANDALFMD